MIESNLAHNTLNKFISPLGGLLKETVTNATNRKNPGRMVNGTKEMKMLDMLVMMTFFFSLLSIFKTEMLQDIPTLLHPLADQIDDIKNSFAQIEKKKPECNGECHDNSE